MSVCSLENVTLKLTQAYWFTCWSQCNALFPYALISDTEWKKTLNCYAFLLHPYFLHFKVNICSQVTQQNSHSSHICGFFFSTSEGLDSHQGLPLCPTLGAPPPQWMYLIPLHYSRLAPIHIQQSVANWAASLYKCRDVPSQPNEKKYRELKTSCREMFHCSMKFRFWIE